MIKTPDAYIVSACFSLATSDRETILDGAKAPEVLLVFPGKYGAPEPQIPLPLLHIASPLRRAGYRVRILDMRLDDYAGFNLGDPVFVGISTMSGQQISYGLELARKIRAEAPSLPLVWGGVHPTLLPEQTAESEFVDVVVRGEGEMPALELANRLRAGLPIDDVPGITYKTNGKVRSNPDGPLIDLDSIPVELPFDLLQIDKYPTLQAGRFHMQTSRGCPGRCGFCYNTIFNKRRWRGKSAQRVLDEIEQVLKTFPQVTTIDPVDDNFFVDQQRVEEICNGLLSRGVKVKWRANCRFDYLADYSQAFVSLLERAGCVELDFGGETGSVELQEKINKDIIHEQMLRGVENLKKWAPTVEPFISWLSGLPNETEQDLNKTFDLMDQMRKVNPKTQHYGVFVYTPFPSPLIDQLGPEFKAPQSLEEWGKIEVFHFMPPWHTKKYVEKLHVVSAVTRYAFYPEARIRERDFGYRFGYNLMNRSAKFRWKHRWFSFPVELKVMNFVARRFRGYL
jgi:anaerobic magnesium-protoporphyrin IX monomethyl ester cyclase